MTWSELEDIIVDRRRWTQVPEALAHVEPEMTAVDVLGACLATIALVALIGVVAWTLVEAIRIPADLYRSIGTWKGMWIVMLLLFGPLSPAIIAFWLIIRPRLLRVRIETNQEYLQRAPPRTGASGGL